MLGLAGLVHQIVNTTGSNNPELDARLEHKRKLQREWFQKRRQEMTEEERKAARKKRNEYYRDYTKRKKESKLL